METPQPSVPPAAAPVPTPPVPHHRRAMWFVWAAVALLAVATGLYLWLGRPAPGGQPSDGTGSSGKTVLTYVTHWDDFQTEGIFENGVLKYKGLNQYLEEYERLHTDIDIKTVFIEFADYPAGLKVLNDSGAVPDIYQIYSTWGVSFARDGLLAVPPADVQDDVHTNYVSTAGVTIDGKVWGIPTEVNDYLLLYNKKMFKEAGIVDAAGNARPPKDWNEAVDIAARLAQKDAQGRLTRYGFSFLPDIDDFTTDPFLSVLFTNDGRYLSDDLTKCRLNEPAGVQALDKFLGLFRRGATDPEGNFYDFGKGKVAMVIAAPWVENDFRTSLGGAFDETVGVAPIPALKKRATMQYSWFVGVMEGSKHKEQAWDFLRWFTQDVQPATGTTRYSDLLAQNIGAIPSRKTDIPGEVAFLGTSFRKPYVDELPYSVPEPNVPQAAEVKGALREQIQKAWVGGVSAQQAMNDACAAIDALLKE